MFTCIFSKDLLTEKMEDNPTSERDDEGFADCDSPEDDVMETNLAAEGEGEIKITMFEINAFTHPLSLN